MYGSFQEQTQLTKCVDISSLPFSPQIYNDNDSNNENNNNNDNDNDIMIIMVIKWCKYQVYALCIAGLLPLRNKQYRYTMLLIYDTHNVCYGLDVLIYFQTD